MTSKFKRGVLFGAALILPIVVILAIIAIRPTQERRAVDPAPGVTLATEANPEYIAAVEHWGSCDFVLLKNGETVGETVEAVVVTGDRIDGRQEEALRTTLRSYVEALHEPTFYNFSNFRFPLDEVLIDVEVLEETYGDWLRNQLPSEESLPDDGMELLEAVFNGLIRVDEITGRYLREICVEQSFVEVSRFGALPVEEFEDVLRQGLNAGIARQMTTVSFNPTVQDVYDEEGEVTIATMFIVGQTVHDEPAFPFACRVYWVPDESVWVPFEHAIPYVGSRTGRFVF